MTSTDFAAFAILILFVTAIFTLIPRFRKRNIYFGVTVDPVFRHSLEGRSIAARFRLILWSGAACALLCAWLAYEFASTLALVLALILLAASLFGAWIAAWSATRPHSVSVDTVRRGAIYAQPAPLPGGLVLFLLPYLGPIGAALWLAASWDLLPDRYPVHYGFSGQADRWVAKSPAAVFFTPLISFVVLTLMLFLALMIQRRAAPGSNAGHAAWSARYRALNVRMIVALMWLISAMTSILAAGPLLPADLFAWSLRIAPFAILAAVLGFAVPLIRMSMQPTGGSDATPDHCWKLGLFYVNPDDPALIVERRDSPGFTLNLGNRLSWIILPLILLLVLLPLLLSRYLRGA